MNILPNPQTYIDDRTQEEITLDTFRGPGYRADVFDLHSLVASACPWHWHNETEVFYVQQGSLVYRTTEGVFRFDEGDAGFVNSGILHMTEAVGAAPAIQQYHIFAPRMIACPLNNTVEKEYIEPLTRNYAAALIRFSSETTPATALRECMDRAYNVYSARDFGFEIRLRNALSELWLILLENMPRDNDFAAGSDIERVRAMIRFIEAHYAQKITLEDITRAAHIGKGEGARCFKRLLHMTIFDYVIGYRIDRSKEMLSHSTESITSISQNCGFPSQNYFGKVFREKTSLTPSEYRMKYRKSPPFH